MKKIIFAIGLITLASCGNNPQTEKTCEEKNDTTEVVTPIEEQTANEKAIQFDSLENDIDNLLNEI